MRAPNFNFAYNFLKIENFFIAFWHFWPQIFRRFFFEIAKFKKNSCPSFQMPRRYLVLLFVNTALCKYYVMLTLLPLFGTFFT